MLQHRHSMAVVRDVLWSRVSIEPTAMFDGHQAACLALAFVPALPSTLVWLEAHERVHIADVSAPLLAHQVVHLQALPAQIALARLRAAELSLIHI